MTTPPADLGAPCLSAPAVEEVIAREGADPALAEALLAFDQASWAWQRMVAKGELPAALLGRMGSDLDLAAFQALGAVLRIEGGIGRAPAAATVGRLAEELSVDPSRASRLAADLVQRGLLRREADQSDGRASVLAPTGEGRALLAAFRAAKWRVLARVFRGWRPDDLAAFARAVEGYGAALRAELSALRDEG